MDILRALVWLIIRTSVERVSYARAEIEDLGCYIGNLGYDTKTISGISSNTSIQGVTHKKATGFLFMDCWDECDGYPYLAVFYSGAESQLFECLCGQYPPTADVTENCPFYFADSPSSFWMVKYQFEPKATIYRGPTHPSCYVNNHVFSVSKNHVFPLTSTHWNSMEVMSAEADLSICKTNCRNMSTKYVAIIYSGDDVCQSKCHLSCACGNSTEHLSPAKDCPFYNPENMQWYYKLDPAVLSKMIVFDVLQGDEQEGQGRRQWSSTWTDTFIFTTGFDIAVNCNTNDTTRGLDNSYLSYGLSLQIITGIIIGSAAFLIVFIGLIIFLLRRRKQKQADNSGPDTLSFGTNDLHHPEHHMESPRPTTIEDSHVDLDQGISTPNICHLNTQENSDADDTYAVPNKSRRPPEYDDVAIVRGEVCINENTDSDEEETDISTTIVDNDMYSLN